MWRLIYFERTETVANKKLYANLFLVSSARYPRIMGFVALATADDMCRTVDTDIIVSEIEILIM